MILLTGATGLTGQLVAKAVSQKGERVRALVRSPEKAQGLADLGIELVQGDLGDPASIARAFEGVDKAFLLMANVEEQLDHEKRFIDAAKTAGVSHLVKLSAIGAQAGHSNKLKHYHGASEDHLKASGLSYTILQGNVFMQYMLYFLPVIEATNAFYVPAVEADLGMVDLRDLAEVAALTLTQDGHAGKTYVLTGPEMLSFQDVANAFGKALGKDVSAVQIPAEAFKAEMVKTGQSDWTATAVTEEFELMGDGMCAHVNNTIAEILGRPAHSFEDLLKSQGIGA